MMLRVCIPLVSLFAGVALLAQEKGAITSPVARPSLEEVEIQEIRIGRSPTWSLAILYSDNTGHAAIDYHVGTVAANGESGADVLVKALNKANLSTKSLECRAIEHLVTHGKIPAATCTGAPQ